MATHQDPSLLMVFCLKQHRSEAKHKRIVSETETVLSHLRFFEAALEPALGSLHGLDLGPELLHRVLQTLQLPGTSLQPGREAWHGLSWTKAPTCVSTCRLLVHEILPQSSCKVMFLPCWFSCATLPPHLLWTTYKWDPTGYLTASKAGLSVPHKIQALTS